MNTQEIIQAINKALTKPEFSQASQDLLTTRFNRGQIIQSHLNLYQSL